MDPDMNKYALSHRVTHHAKMSDAEWEGAFEKAWKTYYNRDAHRAHPAARRGAGEASCSRRCGRFYGSGPTHLVERVHPVEAGYIRRRVRTERRPGMPIESPLVFYPKHWTLTAVRQGARRLAFADASSTSPGRSKRDPAKREIHGRGAGARSSTTARPSTSWR